MCVIQKGAELGFQPPSEDLCVARSVKQDRGGPAFADPGGQQGSPRSAVSRGQAVHPRPLPGIRVPPDTHRGKATFIDVDKLLAAADIALTQAQIPLSFQQAALGVPQRFFFESRPSAAGHARYNAGTPQSGARVLFGSDPGPVPRVPSMPPNPGGGDAGVRSAGRPARPGHSARYRHWHGTPETGEPLRPCCHPPVENRVLVCVNPMSSASFSYRTSPYLCLDICELRYKWPSLASERLAGIMCLSSPIHNSSFSWFKKGCKASKGIRLRGLISTVFCRSNRYISVSSASGSCLTWVEAYSVGYSTGYSMVCTWLGITIPFWA